MALSRDGRRIVSGSADKTVRVWYAKTGKEFRRIPGHEERVSAALFSRDGRHILSAERAGRLRIWNASSGKELDSILVDGRPACLCIRGTRVWVGTTKTTICAYEHTLTSK